MNQLHSRNSHSRGSVVGAAHATNGRAEPSDSGAAKQKLRQIAFWADRLTQGEASRALKGTIERSFSGGAYICHRGDQFDYWTGVVSGLVKKSAISASGKAITFAGAGAGSWFGEGTILKNEARKYDLVTLRDTRLSMMNRTTFMWLFENSFGFTRFLVQQLNERMGNFVATIECDRIHDPAARVARHLAALSNATLHHSGDTRIEITQEELALFAGVPRLVVNRSVRRLQAEGLMVTDRGGMTILDMRRLARYGG